MRPKVKEVTTEEDNVAVLSRLCEDVGSCNNEIAVAVVKGSEADFIVTFDDAMKAAYMYGDFGNGYTIVAQKKCFNEFKALDMADNFAALID